MLYPRGIQPLVEEALQDTPVVCIMGARQAGKSTLTKTIVASGYNAQVFSLDDQSTREGALSDPTGFVAGLTGPTLIDEVQRAPDLILAIKDSLEKDRTPGRYLLTGSSNLLGSRKIQESLTGRIELIEMGTLSQAEIHSSAGNFIDALFAVEIPQVQNAVVGRDSFASIVVQGGYPEALTRTGRRRDSWFRNYLKTTLERDLRDVTDLYKEEEMPRLISVLAPRAGNLLSYLKVSKELQLDDKTVRKYVKLLETIFLIKVVPAWRPSFIQRAIHTPKLYFSDSGLLAYLLSANEQRVTEDDKVTGIVLENFVGTEIMKQREWSITNPRVYHFRDRDGSEVDVVMESRSGEVVGIEVKARASVKSEDAKGLVKLRESAKGAFKAGVILYTGDKTVPLGDRIWAVPLSGLWA